MRKIRLGDALEPEPASRECPERDVGKRERVTFDMAARGKLNIENAPDLRGRIGTLLERNHVALLGRRADQSPEYRTFNRLHGRKRPVQPAVDRCALPRLLRIDR